MGHTDVFVKSFLNDAINVIQVDPWINLFKWFSILELTNSFMLHFTNYDVHPLVSMTQDYTLSKMLDYEMYIWRMLYTPRIHIQFSDCGWMK